MAKRCCPATFLLSRACCHPVASPPTELAYGDENATWHVYPMRLSGCAMKNRCPRCGYIADDLPPSLRCPDCDNFSHDWLIYDWESFSSVKRRHSKYNLSIIGITLANLFVAVTLKSTDAFQWLFSLLFIPAIIDFLYCHKQLENKSGYEGHKGKSLFFWFFGFGGS